MSNSSHTDDSNLCLTPREEKFSLPEKLKRSEMDGLDASLWEELCIAAAENEQPSNHTLLNNEEFKQEVNTYKLLKLTANEQIFYSNKSSLKRSSSKIGLWISVAAAVVTLLIVVPAAIRNYSPNTTAPKVAAIPDTLKNAKEEQHSPNHVNQDIKEEQNSPAIAQATKEAAQPKAKPSSVSSNIKEAKAETANPIQEQKRAGLGLAAVEPAIPSAVLVASTTEAAQPLIQPLDQNIIILASSDELQPIEVEKVGFLDRLKEKSIVNVNRLLGQGTMVVKEYDSDGKLTLYAVQSNTLNFEKEYTE